MVERFPQNITSLGAVVFEKRVKQFHNHFLDLSESTNMYNESTCMRLSSEKLCSVIFTFFLKNLMTKEAENYTVPKPFKDAMSDFWLIRPKKFDLKFNRYFDGGRENYKLPFEPLLK